MSLILQHIHKSYAARQVLLPLDLHLEQHCIHALLGPSGSGKTTLLKLIAGLESLDGGEIYWNTEKITQVPVHQRQFSMVFQDYALFPHLSVCDNVAYGLREKGFSSLKAKQEALSWLKRVDLADAADHCVDILSGGEQQRVALVRALAVRPRLLLLDEPLSHLDPHLKRQLMQIFYELLHEHQQTVLWVTHDQHEAMHITSHMHILLAGTLKYSGKTQDVYRSLQSLEMATFLDVPNIVQRKQQWFWLPPEAFSWGNMDDSVTYRLLKMRYLPQAMEVHVTDGKMHYCVILSNQSLQDFLNASWQINDRVPLSIDWSLARGLKSSMDGFPPSRE